MIETSNEQEDEGTIEVDSSYDSDEDKFSKFSKGRRISKLNKVKSGGGQNSEMLMSPKSLT